MEPQLMHYAYAVSSCSKLHLKGILLYDYLPLKNFDVNIQINKYNLLFKIFGTTTQRNDYSAYKAVSIHSVVEVLTVVLGHSKAWLSIRVVNILLQKVWIIPVGEDCFLENH